MAITPSVRLDQQNIYDIQKNFLYFSSVIDYNDTHLKTHDITQKVTMRHEWNISKE